jgi:hypothetical protein
MQAKHLTTFLIISFLFINPCFAFDEDEPIVIKAVVLKLGPKPNGFGGARKHQYQLAKYRVEQVYKGKYEEKEIIVDHFMDFLMRVNPIEGLKIGDKVCLEVYRQEGLAIRYAKGIRSRSDKAYYLSDKITKSISSSDECKCSD